MNLLTDAMPRAVAGLPIDTSFRRMVQFELLMDDATVPAVDKIGLAIDLLYLRPIRDLQAAWEGLLWYYRGGEPAHAEGCGQTAARPRRSYSFAQDDGYIYAAFWQVYGLDLQQTDLHWWAFRKLLFALPDTCLMGRIMGYRLADTSKLKGAERKRIEELQRAFAIRTELENAFSASERAAAMRTRALRRYKEAMQWKNRSGR
ncbi:MAG: Gp15 family bacteriophage protein [Gemmiger sp.]